MAIHIRHEGQPALDWANEHSFDLWMVWRYARSQRTLVISCQQGEPQEIIGFLVLRGVESVHITPHIGNAGFALKTWLPSVSAAQPGTTPAQAASLLLEISGKDQVSSVLFESFALYIIVGSKPEDR